MKKTIFLCAIFISIIIAGCDEGNLLADFNGLWHVQKYTSDGVDKTRWFDSTYANFKWFFSTGDIKAFTKVWQHRATINTISFDTTQHVDTITHITVIDRIDTLKFIEPYTAGDTVSGDWYLTNSNKFFVTRDPLYGTTQYQIIDHSPGSLHLVKGNEHIYLSQ